MDNLRFRFASECNAASISLRERGNRCGFLDLPDWPRSKAAAPVKLTPQGLFLSDGGVNPEPRSFLDHEATSTLRPDKPCLSATSVLHHWTQDAPSRMKLECSDQCVLEVQE